MQTGTVSGYPPRSAFRSSGPSTCSNEDHVSRRNSDTCLTFPGFDVLDVNGSLWLKVRKTLKSWKIEENASCDYSVFEILDAKLSATIRSARR